MAANPADTYGSFEEVNDRLNQIVAAVADENLPLDEALALYEEAVNLGLRGSDLLEENIQAYDEGHGDKAAEEGAENQTDSSASDPADQGEQSIQADAQ